MDTIHPLSEILIPPAATLRDALAAIQAGKMKITVIVDGGRKLLGIVTDADTRQAILDGIGLDEPVTRVMNTDPLVAKAGTDRRQMFAMMRRARVMLLPVVDDSGRVTRIETFFEAFHLGERSNTVVLLAGGRGRRLAPLTQARPKPMLQVGTKPILETILDSFSEFGFRDFRIAVALGLPADMKAITEVAGEFGLPVIADAAAALGARYRGHPLASLGATLSVISFNGNKPSPRAVAAPLSATIRR